MVTGTTGSGPVRWAGRQAIFVTPAGLDDDTLRIATSRRDEQIRLELVLPTLCITYANLHFANSIGGSQADWPEAASYGPAYFDPPVVISGAHAIEKLTWIRGAERVEIGPHETTIQWTSWRDLVIPKLRIESRKLLVAHMVVPELSIPASHPLLLDVIQYADGRAVGGVQVAKYHPEWRPDEPSSQFDLWVRALDGKTGDPLPKARVSLYGGTSNTKHGLEREGTWYTNEAGVVAVAGLPRSPRKLVTVEHSPWLTRVWRFNPLPGQPVRRTFELWRTAKSDCRYAWRVKDRLEHIAALGGVSQPSLLGMNRLRSEKELRPGLSVVIPCWEAVYHPTTGEDLEGLAAHYCYRDGAELAEAAGLSEPFALFRGQSVALPGWRYLFAEGERLFEDIDEQLGLDRGWARPAERVLHDDPRHTYPGEVVAVPKLEFTAEHRMQRLY